MADLFKACGEIYWGACSLDGCFPPETKTVCAYGATKGEAIEAANNDIDSACPWWISVPGGCDATKAKIVYTFDSQKWFNNVFKFFS